VGGGGGGGVIEGGEDRGFGLGDRGGGAVWGGSVV